MELKLPKLTAAYFDSIGFSYSLEGENNEVIITGMGDMNNMSSVSMVFIFDTNDKGVQAFIPSLLKIPASKLDSMYRVINTINSTYRWVKFYITDSGDVRVDVDAILDPASCGEECLGLWDRLGKIADHAYPVLMKGLWA